MLTCTTEIRKYSFWLRVYGTKDNKTSVYRFLDDLLEDDSVQKKLDSVLRAINSNPLKYSHEQKFKHLEDNVWEIKIYQIRIACIWDTKPHNLIAIYGFIKKQNKWSKHDLNNMRREKNAYLALRCTRIEGDEDGRIREIPCK